MAITLTYNDLAKLSDTFFQTFLLNVDDNYDTICPKYARGSYKYEVIFKANNPMAKGTKTKFTLNDGISKAVNSTTRTFNTVAGVIVAVCTYSQAYLIDKAGFTAFEQLYTNIPSGDILTYFTDMVAFAASKCFFKGGFNDKDNFDATSNYLFANFNFTNIPTLLGDVITKINNELNTQTADSLQNFFNSLLQLQVSTLTTSTASYTITKYPV